MDWGNLPPLLVSSILKQLTQEDRLIASSVCSSWREAIFHPMLWRDLVLRLNCRCSVKQAEFLLRRNVFRYVDSVILFWYDGKQSDKIKEEIIQVILKIFQQLGDNTHIEKLVLRLDHPRIHNNGWDNADMPDDINIPHIQSLLNVAIENNLSSMKYLSFVYNSLLIPPGLIRNFNMHFTNMRELHIACKRRNFIGVDKNIIHCTLPKNLERNIDVQMSSQESEDGKTLSGACNKWSTNYKSNIKCTCLDRLEELSINWIDLTDELMNKISSPSLRKINLFVHRHLDCSFHPSVETWNRLFSKSPDIKISLCFVDELDGVCDQLEYIPSVFAIKMCEVDDYAEDPFGKVYTWFRDSVQCQLMIYTKTAGMILPDRGAGVGNYLAPCRNIKYKAVIGHYFSQDVIKMIASYLTYTLGVKLENFIWTHENIHTYAEASDYMITISGTKYENLCRRMSEILGKDWKAISKSKLPLKGCYFSDGKDDLIYTSSSPHDEVRRIGSDPVVLT